MTPTKLIKAPADTATDTAPTPWGKVYRFNESHRALCELTQWRGYGRIYVRAIDDACAVHLMDGTEQSSEEDSAMSAEIVAELAASDGVRPVAVDREPRGAFGGRLYGGGLIDTDADYCRAVGL